MKQYLYDGAKAIPLKKLPPEAWTRPDGKDESDIQTRYEAVAFLYRCTHLRASAMTQVPLMLHTFPGDEHLWSDDEVVPFNLEWLENLDTLLYLAGAALTLGPEAFWFREMVRGGEELLQLRWHAPSTVVPQWDVMKGLTGFKRTIGTTSTIYRPEQYIHFPRPNPFHETLPGSPPGEAAMSAAGVLYNVDQYSTSYFERGAIAGTLLTVDETNSPISDPERDKLRAWWRRAFSGISKTFQTEVFRLPVTPVRVGDGLDGLTDSTLTQEKREDIATALGVPHSKVFSNSANYATAQIEERAFYVDTVLPELRLVLEAINQQMLRDMGLMLKAAPEKMEIFQQNESERSGSLLNLVNAGMDLRVALEVLGYDNIPEGEIERRLADTIYVTNPAIEDDSGPPALPDKQAEKALWDEEGAKFRRWAKKRTDARPWDFESRYLTMNDKAAILNEMEDAGGHDSPFLERLQRMRA